MWDVLKSVDGPAIYTYRTDARGASQLALDLYFEGVAARVVRGRKMRTAAGLFDEFAAALQFPYYFGENWPAFDECLCEIEESPLAAGFVLVIQEADQVLVDDHPAEIEAFTRIVNRAHETYSEPIDLNESWDRPAVPFHCVLQQPRAADARWTAAGASLTTLTTP